MSSPSWTHSHPGTCAGPAGTAWKIDVAKLVHQVPDTKATLAVWLVWCPGAHPFWHWWLISVIHLRPLEGVRPAFIREPGATHEVIVASLDPDHPIPDPRAFRIEDIRFLTPIDVMEQFQVASDVEAEEICALAVRACCDGRLSPDQDFRSLWHATLKATAQHYRGGQHRTDS